MLKGKLSLILMLFFSLSANYGSPADIDINEDNQQVAVESQYQVDINLYSIDATHKLNGELVANLTALLEEHLSIIKKTKNSDLDEEQKGYLLIEAPDEINQILGTEGFFNNQISIEEKNDNGKERYLIRIGLTKPILIKNKIIVLSGEIEDDDQLAAYYTDIFSDWRLNLNQIFNQKLWTQSKNLSLTNVQKRKYPLAVIKESAVQLNVQENSAILSLEIASGHSVQFGNIVVTGAERYPQSIAKNMARFDKGSDYDLDILLDYQQQLEQDGHFSEVVVIAALEEIKDNQVPIYVLIKEQFKKSFAINLTYDSNEKFGTSIEYLYYNFLNQGYTAGVTASYSQFEQRVSLGFTQPRRANGRFWTTSTDFFKGSKNGLNTKLWSMGLWYVYTKFNFESRLGLEYYWESQKIKQGPSLGINNVLLVTAQWKINQIKTLLRPANGYYLLAKIGSSMGRVLSSTPLRRIEIVGQYYLTPWDVKYGTFLVKAQVGYISTKKPERIPDELRFTLGGADSVRGYPTKSIGIGKNNIILGGVAKVAATLEYQVPISRNFSLAVFHDVGDVKNRFKDIKLKHSTGIGLRWFSPVAPLSFDLAYAHDRKKVGGHLNLGAKF